jgi:hypothetical protein
MNRERPAAPERRQTLKISVEMRERPPFMGGALFSDLNLRVNQFQHGRPYERIAASHANGECQ